ncbi:SGNH/GDSL hydrolase family protein [Thalassobacillus hwangdonensis]|uniref:SGNH/GDSL hydrolase family protein n=1 Tax=Thalassobacillus hwangdonensis TaxID=546108 RepID=A0ABW3L1H3_9BACI
MQKRTIIGIIVAVTIITGLFIIFFLQGQSSSPSGYPSLTDQQENTGENEGDAGNPDEETSSEENNVRDDLRDAFTNVIENAVGLFVKDDLDIVAIGDSLTQGVGDETENGGYVGILENTLSNNGSNQEITIENYGKRGNRTDQLLKRMEKEEIRDSIQQADIVLITIGANDVMKVVKDNFSTLDYNDFKAVQDDYQDRLTEIFSIIYEENPDAKVYLLGLYNPFSTYFNNIPELGQIMNDWNEIGKAVVAKDENSTFIPIEDLFINKEDEFLWKQDHFHPNKNGYKAMAERVLEYIKADVERSQ